LIVIVLRYRDIVAVPAAAGSLSGVEDLYG
jgi:hypothetical protein